MKPIVSKCIIVLGMLLVFGTCLAQMPNFAQMGQVAYDKHAYADGAPLFLLAAQLEPNNAGSHLYNAACCYALAGQKDLALYSLGTAIKKGWKNKAHTESDEDLSSLRSDPRWKGCMSLFPAAVEWQDNKDAIINDLNNLAAQAYQYRIRPTSMGGGQGSYNGFKIPVRMATNANAAYETLVVEPNLIRYKATSAKGSGTVEASIDGDGRLSNWKYGGEFAESSKAKEGTSALTSTRDALINQMNNIAAYCYQYRIRPTSMGGGNGTYTGAKLPEKLAVTDDGTFSLEDVGANSVKIQAVSKKFKGSITTTLDAGGRTGYWTYYGELQ